MQLLGLDLDLLSRHRAVRAQLSRPTKPGSVGSPTLPAKSEMRRCDERHMGGQRRRRRGTIAGRIGSIATRGDKLAGMAPVASAAS